jgi:hypothetical protein
MYFSNSKPGAKLNWKKKKQLYNFASENGSPTD